MRSILVGFIGLALAGLVVACGAAAGPFARPAARPSSAGDSAVAVAAPAIPAPTSPAVGAATGSSATPALFSAPNSTNGTNVLLSIAQAPTRSTQAQPAKPPRTPYKTPVPASIPGVNLAENVPYVERPGADPHATSMDIYVPAAARNLPVLMYVHGGGWAGGDHEPVGAKAAYFTGRGYVFVSVNYRLAPAVRPREQAADIAEAVAWVVDEIAAYGGDGTRLFLLGHSAGAHLVALVASDETILQGVGLNLTAIRGVILLDSAAYDVEQLMRTPEGQTDTFRPIFGTDPALWRPVSPCAHVGPAKGIPPHLLLLATATGERRPAAEGLAAALRAAGVYAQIADATAFRNHNTITEDLGQPGDTPTAAVQAFLDMLLRGAPAGLGGTQVLQPGARP